MALKKEELRQLKAKRSKKHSEQKLKNAIMSRVMELGRLRELTLKGSLASPTSITRKGTRTYDYGLST
jgi:hypothetical protein